MGANGQSQLHQHLRAMGRLPTPAEGAVRDAASAALPPYPHAVDRRQEGLARLDPAPI